MALVAHPNDMNGTEKPTHPFFTKQQRDPSPKRTTIPRDHSGEQSGHESEYTPADNSATAVHSKKKRERKSEKPVARKRTSPKQKTQASLEQFTRKPNAKFPGDAAEEPRVPDNVEIITVGESSLEEDPNFDRRKRVRTGSPPPTVPNDSPETASEQTPEGLDWHQLLQVAAGIGAKDSSIEVSAPSEARPATPAILTGDPPQALPTEAAGSAPTTPKKKMLKIGANGKLVSPGAEAAPVASSSPKPRGLRRSARRRSLGGPTVIRYGQDATSRSKIGKKIENILSGCDHAVPPREPPKEPSGPPKPTHPFFVSIAAQKHDVKTASKPTTENRAVTPIHSPKKTAATPGKLRTEARQMHPPISVPLFGPIPGDRQVLKHTGMSEAPWPSKENCHVRNLKDQLPLVVDATIGNDLETEQARKLKSMVVNVPERESIITVSANRLQNCFHWNLEDVRWRETMDSVRFPERLLTTGPKIQDLVRRQVKAKLTPDGQPAASQGRSRKGVHPVLQALFDDIGHVLTPFDNGECEPQSWSAKYAPQRASDVLQCGKEAGVLRDWLRNLTVTSVESRKLPGKGSKPREGPKPARKKRKHAEDDFIVSGDESEDNGLVEVSDTEDFGPPVPGHSRVKSQKTNGTSRDRNVVVLSGPHGCGKSATVYAVAKELNFEVFEINSSSRRSGKDVQDRVGDMTENHLVSHRSIETVAPEDDTNDLLRSEALQKDIETGRQATMASFFQSVPRKSKAKPKPKPKGKSKMVESTKAILTDSTKHPLPGPRQTPKQSLILLEEADILFEEDQQFWAQVFRLASQSKRPIIITCNDEGAIPDDLPLGAYLRFSPPPVDLATDYMLLLCAREGHILERKAVRDLYEAKEHDLRASIMELDFWCQMSVGDRKGGLEWMYQRWPPGKDVDEGGKVLRVASKGTYMAGMGWVSHDISTSQEQGRSDKEEELLKEVWQEWGVRPTASINDDQVYQDELAPSQENEASAPSTAELISRLQRLEQYAESVSAADVYCQVGMPMDDNEPLDPSLPPILAKEHLNYPEGGKLLQGDAQLDFSNLDTSLFVQSQLSIGQAFGSGLSLGFEGHGSLSVTDQTMTQTILDHKAKARLHQPLSRNSYYDTFVEIALLPSASLGASSPYYLNLSDFHRPFSILVEDLAPFIRSIVDHEIRLEKNRIRVSNLLSLGGRSKRMRTTRASRVAAEGGRRETKRRDHWFGKDLDKKLVMETAGKAWAALGSLIEESEGSCTADSLRSAQDE